MVETLRFSKVRVNLHQNTRRYIAEGFNFFLLTNIEYVCNYKLLLKKRGRFFPYIYFRIGTFYKKYIKNHEIRLQTEHSTLCRREKHCFLTIF